MTKKTAGYIGPISLKLKGYKTAEEIAELSGLSVTHIRHLARLGPESGGIPGEKVGRRWYFIPSEVHKALAGGAFVDVDDVDNEAIEEFEQINEEGGAVYASADDL